MERDFMGLNSVKESFVTMKEEVSDAGNESEPAKAQQGSALWSFANKVTAVPHFSKQNSTQEETVNKSAPSGFIQYQVGFLGKKCPSAGLADLRNKSAGSPAQMTIFYNGTVKVYDSITPEKAQAIMFLAGNASCIVTNDSHIGTQHKPPTPKFGVTDIVPVSQGVTGQHSSALSSSISFSSHNGAKSISSSTNTAELVTNNTSTKPLTGFGLAAASSMIPPHSIPQFRKVSLARFLEKRKERAMNAAPYNAAKKPECTT